MISYDQFKANYVDGNGTSYGKFVDVDHAYGNQCWDLVALYNEQVVGVPASAGWGLPTGPDLDAKDVWLYFLAPLPSFFDKVPANQMQKGDIVVWGFAPDGHIAIFDHAVDGNNFVSLDQNWPIGSSVHLQNHNYTNVLGGLRPKGNIDMAKYSEEQIKVLATLSTGSAPGVNYNYPETTQEVDFDTLNQVLQTWQNRTALVTAELEETIAKIATGSPYGKDYNSHFQGKPVLAVLVPMLNFWLGQRSTDSFTAYKGPTLYLQN